MDSIQIGERIRRLREQNGWSRDIFSEKIGISNMYLCQIEKGQKNGSLPLIVKISETLNISLDFLIYGDNSIDINKQEVIDMINEASNRQLKIIKEVLLNLKK